MKNILLEVGVKAFLKKGDKFLFLKRAQPYPNETICKWDIPGGRIDPGEEVLKGLKRELEEETGLTLKKASKILAVQDIKRINYHTVRITYFVETTNFKVKIDPKEHQEFAWLTIGELEKLDHDPYLVSAYKLTSF